MPAKRIVPLIVAVALFMENMDSTVIATSLPAIAADIGTSPLTLKLAVTSYLLSLAVFIPVSGWTADRFGALTVFRAAIAVFMLGSIGCALSGTLTQFVAARILEGMGGAMMTPVARLILVRSVDRRELINAMIWVTLPALIGPLIGPALGGFITTYISWHWIFLINIPIGLAGIVLATIFIEDVKAETPDPFDLVGAVLAGLGIGGLVFGGSLLGLNFLPTGVVIALIVAGAVATYAYVLHARRTPAPVLDLSLLQIPTMRAAVVGGFIYRAGIGAMPFLLPLLLQLGFGLTPFQSGLITLSNVVGAMGMKTVIPIILRRFGFRQVLVVNALISAVFVAACATFTPGVPFAWIVGVLRHRRLLPLARVHQPQHHRLCRRRQPPHEPRDLAGRSRPTGIDLGRRRHRRACGGPDAVGARAYHDHRRRLPAGIHHHRPDLCLRVFLLCTIAD